VRVFGKVLAPVFDVRLPAEIARGEKRQEETALGRERFQELEVGFAHKLCKSMPKVRVSGSQTMLFTGSASELIGGYARSH